MKQYYIYLIMILCISSIVLGASAIRLPSATGDTGGYNMLNVTTYVTSVNNITNNFTSYVTNNITNNITNYVIINTTNNITYNVTNDIYVNTTNNITNNYYAGWITIENNVTAYVNFTNNITNNVTVQNNITNYVDNYITNNITTNVTVAIQNNVNVSIENNVSSNISLTILNITNIYNYTQYYNDTYLLEQLGLKLNITDQRYNDTAYCDAQFSVLNMTLYNLTQRVDLINTTLNARIDLLNTSYYGEITDFDTTYDSLTFTTSGTYYNVTSFPNSTYYSGWSDGTNLVCNKTGMYELTYTMVYSSNGIQNVQFAIFVNGIELKRSVTQQAVGLNNYFTTSKSFIYKFNASDIITVKAQSPDTSGKAITFTNKDVHVIMIGG